MEDTLSLYRMSLVINKKRRRLRETLHDRHLISLHEATVQLDNLYDWSTRMANKVKSLNDKKTEKPKFLGFFNCEIASERKDECKVFIRNEEEVGLLIEQAIASEYKLSLALNVQNGSVQASMTCNDAKSKNAGLSMSAYAPHWYNALAVLMWKHYIYLGGIWEKPEIGDDEDFG